MLDSNCGLQLHQQKTVQGAHFAANDNIGVSNLVSHSKSMKHTELQNSAGSYSKLSFKLLVWLVDARFKSWLVIASTKDLARSTFRSK